MQALIISRLDYGNALLYNIPLSLTNHLQRVELCCASGDTHSPKGTYNTSFVPATLASCTFQIIVQDPVSYIQCIEWNNTRVSKRSDHIPVRMLRSESYSLLRVPRSHTPIYGEKSFRASAPRLWNTLSNHIKIAANKDIFYKVLKPIWAQNMF